MLRKICLIAAMLMPLLILCSRAEASDPSLEAKKQVVVLDAVSKDRIDEWDRYCQRFDDTLRQTMDACLLSEEKVDAESSDKRLSEAVDQIISDVKSLQAQTVSLARHVDGLNSLYASDCDSATMDPNKYFSCLNLWSQAKSLYIVLQESRAATERYKRSERALFDWAMNCHSKERSRPREMADALRRLVSAQHDEVEKRLEVYRLMESGFTRH